MEIIQMPRIDGEQDDDHGSVIQFYEKFAGVKVRTGRSSS
jgi:hypothetical protein